MVSKETLLDPGYKQRWGALYAPNKIENRWQRAFRLQFIVRRFLILAIGFLLYEAQLYQILVMTVINMFALLYVGLVEPFKNWRTNKQEIINEGLVVLMTVHLFTFTEFNDNVETQYIMGWSFCGFVTYYLFYNARPVIMEMLKKFKLLVVKNYRKMCKSCKNS